MTKKKNSEKERREFIRLSYNRPIMYKVCKTSTISKLMKGYTHNISSAGLKCNLQERVPKNCILWLQLDHGALTLCEEIEKRSVIIQHGVLGKVVWEKKEDNGYDIGICFLTREEKRLPNIFEQFK
ncbi:PilZ domain-containing protein [Candidatus Omnitrophota bacterium]